MGEACKMSAIGVSGPAATAGFKLVIAFNISSSVMREEKKGGGVGRERGETVRGRENPAVLQAE